MGGQCWRPWLPSGQERQPNANKPTWVGGSVTRLDTWAELNELRVARPRRDRGGPASRPNSKPTGKKALPAPVLSTDALKPKSLAC